jgi:hypothetical protein
LRDGDACPVVVFMAISVGATTAPLHAMQALIIGVIDAHLHLRGHHRRRCAIPIALRAARGQLRNPPAWRQRGASQRQQGCAKCQPKDRLDRPRQRQLTQSPPAV